MAATPPLGCTVRATHIALQQWPEIRSSAICSRRTSRTVCEPHSDARSRKDLELKSRPWGGRLLTSYGSEQQRSTHVELKKQGLRSPLCFELSTCGVDNASCCSSSRIWNLASATRVVGQGCCEARLHGSAHESCELVMVGGHSLRNGFSLGTAQSRRQRRKRSPEGSLKHWQFIHGVAVASDDGQHPSRSDTIGSVDGHAVRQTPIEISVQEKRIGLRRVPVAFSFTTDVQQNRSLRQICCCSSDDHCETKLGDTVSEEGGVDNLGVQMALALLRFYKMSMRNKLTESMDSSKALSSQPGAFLAAILWVRLGSILQGGLEKKSPLKYDM